MILVFLVFLLVLGSLLIAGSVTLYFILIYFASHLRNKSQSRSTLIVKACTSLLILLLLSLGMFFLLFWMTLAINHVKPHASLDLSDYLQLTAIAVTAVGYALVGWLLARWLVRREQLA